MKFAKQLEQESVPEWRSQYFDYKQGKKKIKAIVNAYNAANRNLRTPTFKPSTRKSFSGSTPSVRGLMRDDSLRQPEAEHSDPIPIHTSKQSSSDSSAILRKDDKGYTHYGSIIGSPSSPLSRPRTLELPGPAIDPKEPPNPRHQRLPVPHRARSHPQQRENAFEVGKTRHSSSSHVLPVSLLLSISLYQSS